MSIASAMPLSAKTNGMFIPTQNELEALAFILPLSPDYPGIEQWFRSKVSSGLRTGTRKIIRIDRHGRIAAIGIGKYEGGEKKICTVRVAPEYVGKGIGIRVFDNLMTWLGTDRPHATVSETKIHEFERIFDYYGYRLTSVKNNAYITGRVEYFFNEQWAPWI